MSPESTLPKLLTVREVSHILRIQRAKVYLLIEMGKLDATKVGADWRIKRSSVEQFTGALRPEDLSGVSYA